MSEHTIVHCTFERHAAAILEIFNEAILNSTALYVYEARTLQNMVDWFEAKRTGGFPVIGIESSSGTLMGHPRRVIQHGTHTRSRAGAPTSSRSSPATRSPRSTSTASSLSRRPRRSSGARSSRRRKGSSSASPRAERSARR